MDDVGQGMHEHISGTRRLVDHRTFQAPVYTQSNIHMLCSYALLAFDGGSVHKSTCYSMCLLAMCCNG